MRTARPWPETIAAAQRIARSVNLPATLDAEAGYGLAPDDLVDALRVAGAAGCNLENDHATGRLADAGQHAEWVGQRLRAAADDRDYRLVINARADVFMGRSSKRAPNASTRRSGGRASTAPPAPTACTRFLHDAGVIRAFVEAADAPILAIPLRRHRGAHRARRCADQLWLAIHRRTMRTSRRTSRACNSAATRRRDLASGVRGREPQGQAACGHRQGDE